MQQCQFKLQLTVNEASDVAFAVLKQDGTLTESLDAATLFDGHLAAAWPTLLLSTAAIPITTSNTNLSHVQTVENLPCGAQLLVWAVARDLTGNIGRPASVLHVATPDVVPPAFTLDTPNAQFDASLQQVQVHVALDEPGHASCVLERCWPRGSAPCHTGLFPLATEVIAQQTLFTIGSTQVDVRAANEAHTGNITAAQVRIVDQTAQAAKQD
jgi:hypothetical protein